MIRKPRTSGQWSGYHMTIKMMASDPTAEQIAERCAEIRAERKPEKLEPVVKPVEIMVTRFSFEE